MIQSTSAQMPVINLLLFVMLDISS